MRTPTRLFVAALAVLALAGCKPKYPKCKADEHCAEKGEVCVEGFCKECTSDSQCKAGYTCRDYACVPAPECRLDEDCASGQRCRSERCVPECTNNRECASSEKCEANRCVPANSCTGDDDCASGKRCDGGECVTDTRGAQELDPEEAARLARLQSCTLETVLFGFNDFALAEESRALLEKNAECIRFHKRPVLIGGHADERGTEEYNLVLAEKRANAAKRYVVGLGVDESLLRTVSYGEERPVDTAQTEAAWAKNRRAEFSFR